MRFLFARIQGLIYIQQVFASHSIYVLLPGSSHVV